MTGIRFAVASDATGRFAGPWFAKQDRKGNVYFGNRSLGGLQKISLHEGGNRICRYADTSEIAGGPRKANIRWIRPHTSPADFSYALFLVFPTSYLGKSPKALPPNILRISPAPEGSAAVVAVFFTREKPEMALERLGPAGCLLSRAPMPSGEFCGIHCTLAPEWEDIDIIVPASYHEQREFRFTAHCPEGVERTISLTLPLEPSVEDGALTLVERHGYAVTAGTLYAPLTKQHYILSRSCLM